ncbi:MAG: AmmeMemoRadiSam system protein A [Gemmatimonadales bacterium]
MTAEEHEDLSTRTSRESVSPEGRRILLKLARRTLEEYLGKGRLPQFEADLPELLERRATFVTLRECHTGELRGCRGEVVAREPLVESVVRMTIASATDDPRFPPVTIDEVPNLEIEVSALSPFVSILPKDIVVGRHGLMIVKHNNSGLLLPQVPESYGWDRDEFLAALSVKAGLPKGAWKDPGSELYSFEAEVWGETE